MCLIFSFFVLPGVSSLFGAVAVAAVCADVSAFVVCVFAAASAYNVSFSSAVSSL